MRQWAIMGVDGGCEVHWMITLMMRRKIYKYSTTVVEVMGMLTPLIGFAQASVLKNMYIQMISVIRRKIRMMLIVLSIKQTRPFVMQRYC